MFPKPQDVLTGLSKQSMMSTSRGSYKNQAESLARNRARFKCILGYSTSF